MGHPSPNHQWDVHNLGLFLLTPPWVRGTSIRALHRPLPLHNQVGWTKAWIEVEVEAEARAHKPGLQGPRGMSTPSHLRMCL